MASAPATSELLLRDRPGDRELLAALDAALDGQGPGLLLLGDDGVGKTAMLRHAAAAALARGFKVGLAEEYAAGVPLLIGAHLARGLRVQPAFSGHAELLAWIRDTAREATSSGGAVFLGFDAVEEYAPADLGVVEDLLRSVPARRAVVVAALNRGRAEGPGAPDHVRRFLDRLRSRRSVRVVDVEPFTTREIADLIGLVLPHSTPAQRFIRHLHTLTLGNPSLILPLLRALPEAGPLMERLLVGSRSIQSLPIPRMLAQQVLAPLATLPEETVDLMRLLAVWGAPADPSLIARLVRTDEASVLLALERLELAGLVQLTERYGGVHFVPPLMSNALRASLGRLQQQRLQQRATELAVEIFPDIPDERALPAARHLLRDPHLTPDRVQFVLRVGRHLVKHSVFDDAHEVLTELVRRARATSSIEVPSEVYALLAESAARIGAWNEAAELLREAADARPNGGPGTEEVLRRSARDHVAHGRVEEALGVYGVLLRDFELDRASRLRILLEAGRVHEADGRTDLALALCRQAVDDAERHGMHDIGAEAKGILASMLIAAADPAAAAELVMDAYRSARAARDPLVHDIVLFVAAQMLGDAVTLKRGLGWLERSRARYEAREQYAGVAYTSARIAEVQIETGDWVRAEVNATLAMQLDTGLNRVSSLRRSRGVLALVRSLIWRPPADESDFPEPSSARAGGAPTFVPEFASQFERQMGAKDYERALATMQSARLMIPSDGWARSLALDVLPRIVRAANAAADRPALELAVRELRELSHKSTFPLVAIELTEAQACLDLVRGELAAAAAGHLAAAQQFDRVGYRTRATRAYSWAGVTFGRMGDVERAEAELRRAHGRWEQIGGLRQRDKTAGYLRGFGRPLRPIRRSAPGLTSRQLEIASLAAQLHTDAEIARQLGISRRTVTTHMHNILKRTGLRSRLDLQQSESLPE